MSLWSPNRNLKKTAADFKAAFAAKNGTPKPLDARDAEIAGLTAEVSRTNVAAPKPRGRHPVRYAEAAQAGSSATRPASAGRPVATAERTDDHGVLRAHGHIPR
jgi:hypothetical protein